MIMIMMIMIMMIVIMMIIRTQVCTCHHCHAMRASSAILSPRLALRVVLWLKVFWP